MELSAGLVVADRFRLLRPLGQGGMGAVWLAQHTGLDTPCAVKFIHDDAAREPDIRARFEREAKAAAQLRSQHVVQILDHGVWEGSPYIAMEYLEGEDLDERLQRCGKLPAREVLAIAVQVGRALGRAHAAGLVHRDLKPGNIFLVREDEREIAKVLDFGIAKVKTAATLDTTTKTGALLGTPFYMSPEQARGAKGIDHRSDLWSLAVVVYQCVTGRAPFEGEALGDLFVKIIVEPVPVPSRVAPVPPGFDAWWARAASRDPAERFQTARELTDALGVALGVTALEGADRGSIPPPPRAPEPSRASLPSAEATLAAASHAAVGAPPKAMPPKKEPAAALRTDAPETLQPVSSGPAAAPSEAGAPDAREAPHGVHAVSSVATARPARRAVGAVVAAGVVAGLVVMGGVGAFLFRREPALHDAPRGVAVRPDAPAEAPAAATATEPRPAAAPAGKEEPVKVTPAVTAEPSASATETQAASAPSASASAVAGQRVPRFGKPAASAVAEPIKGRGKTDFGF